MSVQQTSPSGVSQATVEDVTWGVDMTALLSGSQTVTNADVTLTMAQSGAAVTLQDTPVVTGNVVTQRIRANVLEGSAAFLLTVTFTPSGTTNVLACQLQITVPF